jgi:hypothetical protein
MGAGPCIGIASLVRINMRLGRAGPLGVFYERERDETDDVYPHAGRDPR